jgi:transcriptional regulator with XRE-family HTH domain
MTQQELANASGVSLRTVSNFEDPTSNRQPTTANLDAIQRALERLGVNFTPTGVEWAPPFSERQVMAINALSVRKGQDRPRSSDIITETGCSRGELEALAALGIVESLDGYPLLTAIGHHIPGLMRNYEYRKAEREVVYGPLNYTIHLEDRTIFHAMRTATYRIEEGGDLSVLFDQYVPSDERETAIAGAREALRQHRERSSRVLGQFQRYI